MKLIAGDIALDQEPPLRFQLADCIRAAEIDSKAVRIASYYPAVCSRATT